jgi:hypothetical protein
LISEDEKLKVDISTVGDLEADILRVGNVKVDILRVGIVEVDILRVGIVEVERRNVAPRERPRLRILWSQDVGTKFLAVFFVHFSTFRTRKK